MGFFTATSSNQDGDSKRNNLAAMLLSIAKHNIQQFHERFQKKIIVADVLNERLELLPISGSYEHQHHIALYRWFT